MACIDNLSGDLAWSCDDRPLKGIANSKAIIINYEDIDFGTSTATGATISNLALKSGATGYELNWYKDLASAAGEYTPNEEDIDGFSHSFIGRMMTTTATNAERAKELKAGRFVVVYESKYQGVDQAESFKVLGWDAGIELSEMTTNTAENSSSILFTLSTKEGEYEDYPYNIFLETDYATSSASFEALFAAVV